MQQHFITSGGFRVHYSIRGPDGQARRMLIVGHTKIDEQRGGPDDFANLSLTEVRELHSFLGESLSNIKSGDDKTFPMAIETLGDRVIYSRWRK